MHTLEGQFEQPDRVPEPDHVAIEHLQVARDFQRAIDRSQAYPCAAFPFGPGGVDLADGAARAVSGDRLGTDVEHAEQQLTSMDGLPRRGWYRRRTP